MNTSTATATGREPHPRRRTLPTRAAALLLAGTAASGALCAVSAGPAAAETVTYYEAPCTARALTGDGIKGSGCNSYGPMRVVTMTDPIPSEVIVQQVQICAAGGVGAVIGNALSITSVPSAGAIAALGCAGSLAAAAILAQ